VQVGVAGDVDPHHFVWKIPHCAVCSEERTYKRWMIELLLDVVSAVKPAADGLYV
jgi:hypothetical protein